MLWLQWIIMDWLNSRQLLKNWRELASDDGIPKHIQEHNCFSTEKTTTTITSCLRSCSQINLNQQQQQQQQKQ